MEYSVGEIRWNASFFKKILESDVLLWGVTFLFVAKVFVTVLSVNFPTNQFFAYITRSALEKYANETRVSLGLNPLTSNGQLTLAAEMKARDMIRNQYFAHTSPQGVEPWYWFDQAGYIYRFAGENLAVGFYESEEVFQAWLNSPSHRENVVNPRFSEIGTAVLEGFGENNAMVVVQVFGSPIIKKTSTGTTAPAKPAPATPKPKVPVASQLEAVKEVTPRIELATTSAPGPLWVHALATYEYEKWLQNVLYGASLCIIGLLMSVIFFSIRPVEFHLERRVVFRSVVVVGILSASLLINKSLISFLVSHTVTI